MPVKITHDITDHPTEQKLDDGKVERRRIQHSALIDWLWKYPGTQKMVITLLQNMGLDSPVRRLRAAVKRQAPMETRKALDKVVFDTVLAQRQTIGGGFSDHVRDLFGQYVPWIAIELVGRFLVHIQASSCGKRIRPDYAVQKDMVIDGVSVKTLPPEVQAIVRNASKRSGRTPP